jgi:hypothetical protein
MSYWSVPPTALDDTETLKNWADRAWSAAASAKPAKPTGARRRALGAKELADLPLKPAGKPSKPVKKR